MGKWVMGSFLLTVGAALALYDLSTFTTALLDGAIAAIVLGMGVGLGMAIPQRWLPAGLAFRERLVLAMGLGLGSLSALVLCAGLLGWLSRPILTLAAALLISIGAFRIRQALHRANSKQGDGSAAKPHPPSWHVWFWLALAPFAVWAMAAAAHAPGLLWREEGFGYDALEYHLQIPRESMEQGRIVHLPHNVYSSFPANVEMLYLLGMILGNDVHRGACVAHFIHLGLGALFVFAAWTTGRETSRGAGFWSALTAGSCGWLVYLSGLAFVEHGLLFFGMCGWHFVRRSLATHHASHWIAAGLLIGFAIGCKYTGFVLLLLPLLMIVGLKAVMARLGWMRSCAHVASLGLAALVGCAPWLLKNTVLTGNPVFPLGNHLFQAAPPGWGLPQDAAWRKGHPILDGSIGAIARDSFSRVLLDSRTGWWWLVVVGSFAMLVSAQRRDWSAAIFLFLQWCFWAMLTHRFGRFAVPLLIPIAAGIGRSAALAGDRWKPWIAAALIGGAAWNGVQTMRMYSAEAAPGVSSDAFVSGLIPGYEWLGDVNRDVPVTGRVLMIGESRAFYVAPKREYAVVFNEQPFATLVESGASASQIVDWFKQRGYSHVVVHWAEVWRLSRTYGFSEQVTPELFASLVGAGLIRTHTYRSPIDDQPYVDVFAVP